MNQPGHRRRSAQPRAAARPSKPKPQPRKGNYAFIDSQNLNLGVQKIGWKMDWKRFRQWLTDKYGVTHAYMFIGYIADNESLYELMHDHGYLVVLKPTLEVKARPEDDTHADGKEEQKPIVKGNIDADLVLYAMKEYANYDQAVLVSGDGDFFGLVEYLAQQGKLLKLLTPNQRYSTLLKDFDQYIDGLDQHRRELAYHDRPFRRKPHKPDPSA